MKTPCTWLAGLLSAVAVLTSSCTFSPTVGPGGGGDAADGALAGKDALPADGSTLLDGINVKDAPDGVGDNDLTLPSDAMTDQAIKDLADGIQPPEVLPGDASDDQAAPKDTIPGIDTISEDVNAGGLWTLPLFSRVVTGKSAGGGWVLLPGGRNVFVSGPQLKGGEWTLGR